MKMRPGRNQVTWGITIFFLGVALMLSYNFIFNGKKMMLTLGKISSSLSGIVVGVAIAYILIPLLEGIEEKILIPIYKKRGFDVSIAETADKKKRSQMRTIAVTLTMAIFIFIVYGLFRIVLPQLIRSIREIAVNIPIYVKRIDDYSNLYLASNPDLQEFIDSQLTTYYANLSTFLSSQLIPMINKDAIFKFASQSVASGIKVMIDIIVGFIVAIYVLNSKEHFSTIGKKMAYAFFREDFANELIGGFRFVNNTFEGFIGGKLVDSLIIGIICYIGCVFLKINYPLLVAVIVGVTNIIPFFGPYIGGIAGALLLVLINPFKALEFLIFVVILQQFDGNILGPRILGSSTGLSSFWVIFAISFFGGLWGIVGLLIGVPIFAVFYALVARVTNHFLEKKNLSEDSEDYRDLAYIEQGEYKLLSNPDNNKFNARTEPNTFSKIFNIKFKSRDKKQK